MAKEIKKLNETRYESKLKEDISTANEGNERGLFSRLKEKYNENKRVMFRGLAHIKGVTGTIAAIAHQSTVALNRIDDFADEGFFAEDMYSQFKKTNRRTLEETEFLKMQTSGLKQFKTAMNLQKSFGLMADYSSETLGNISMYNTNLNIANDEAMKYLETLRSITGESIDHNNVLLQQLVMVSKDLGISYTKLLDTLGENSEFFAKYSGQGLKNTLRAVTASQQLGLNFASIAQSLDSLSSLDDVLQRQMKASIFLGKGFNLMEAARFQFAGQTDKAMRSIMGQLGSISDTKFDQPFMRNILAEQTGLSVPEIVKMRQRAQDPDAMRTFDQRLKMNQNLEDIKNGINKIGFGRILKSFNINILEPIQKMFGEGAPLMKPLIGMVDGILMGIGTLIKVVNKTLGLFHNWFGEFGTTLILLGSSVAGIGKLLSRF
jgi:hypothetical protein